MPAKKSVSFLSRRIEKRDAAGWVGAAVLSAGAGIELARGILSPSASPPAFVSALVVALWFLAGVALPTRMRQLEVVVASSAASLFAHGAMLLVTRQPVGLVFLLIAVAVIELTRKAWGAAAAPFAPATSR
jgi:hypothetical protein